MKTQIPYELVADLVEVVSKELTKIRKNLAQNEINRFKDPLYQDILNLLTSCYSVLDAKPVI